MLLYLALTLFRGIPQDIDRYPPVKLLICPPSYTVPVTADISVITISGYTFIDLEHSLTSLPID